MQDSMNMKKSIISYGIIGHNKKGIFRFCLSLKNDTYSYDDFIKGYYKNTKDVIKLLSNMTNEELMRIRKYHSNFDILWNDFWNIKQNSNSNLKILSNIKFDKLNILPLLDNIENNNNISLPWSFPKGKKNIQESDISAAIREFIEETNFTDEPFIKIIENKHKEGIYIIDRYIGDDGKKYETKYYLGYIHNMYKSNYIQNVNNIRDKCISNETKEVKWVSYTEACLCLPQRLINVLNRANKILKRRKRIIL